MGDDGFQTIIFASNVSCLHNCEICTCFSKTLMCDATLQAPYRQILCLAKFDTNAGFRQEELARSAGFSKAFHSEIAFGLMGLLLARK